jgi:hypothetical protein
MEAEQWGVRGEIFEHRVLVHWWVRGGNGDRTDGLASPGAWIAQMRDALEVAEVVSDIERDYEMLVASGQFTSLDEIDLLCRDKLAGLTYAATPAPRVHD